MGKEVLLVHNGIVYSLLVYRTSQTVYYRWLFSNEAVACGRVLLRIADEEELKEDLRSRLPVCWVPTKRLLKEDVWDLFSRSLSVIHYVVG